MRSTRYGCSPTSSSISTPPLTRGQCGVPSSEHSIARLPPHIRPRVSRPSKPASVRKPTASSAPVIASAKQSGVTSSSSARPKSSQASGPHQVGAFVVRQQAHLQRRQVAVADPARAGLDAPGEQLPVDAVEQAREAVAAARGERDARPRARDAVDGLEADVVVAGEALVLGERGLVDRRRRSRASSGAWPPGAAAPRVASTPAGVYRISEVIGGAPRASSGSSGGVDLGGDAHRDGVVGGRDDVGDRDGIASPRPPARSAAWRALCAARRSAKNVAQQRAALGLQAAADDAWSGD